MAQGKRSIKLGNKNDTQENVTQENVSVAAPQPTPPQTASVQAQDTIMTEVHDTLAPHTAPPDTTVLQTAPPPVNGDEDIDEDLQINRNSSVKDKFDFYKGKVRREGLKHADGVNSTINLADLLLEGTVNDAFTYSKRPDGTVIDDAENMYKIFRMPNKNSKPVDTTAGDFTSNVGKYRNMIFLGMYHRAGAQKWFADVKESYEKHLAIPEDRKAMKSFRGTFEAALDIVREQLSRDGQAPSGSAPLMTDDEVFEAMRKKNNTPEDAALDLIIDAYKKLLAAKDGKAASKTTGKGGFAGIADPKFTEVIQALQDYAFNDLDPTRSQTFKSKTAKQKRTRRTIKAPGATNGDTTQDDAVDTDENEEVQAQADTE